MRENPIQQDNTPEIEEMKQRMEDGLQNKPSPKDYRIRYKKIWKGKVAPIGHKFIVVDFYKGKDETKRHYYNSMLIESGYTKEEEQEIAELLRDGLRQKYKV